MRKRLRKKLEKQGRLPEQKPQPWKPAFLGEGSVIARYETLQSLDPDNPLLASGRIDEQGHFQFTEDFYQRNAHVPKPEDYENPGIAEKRATIRYLLELGNAIREHQPAQEPQNTFESLINDVLAAKAESYRHSPDTF